MEKLNLPPSCQSAKVIHSNVLERNVVEKSGSSKSRKRRSIDENKKTGLKIVKTKNTNEKLEAMVEEGATNDNVVPATESVGNNNVILGSESDNENVVPEAEESGNETLDNESVAPDIDDNVSNNGIGDEIGEDETIPPLNIKFEEQYCEPPIFCTLVNKNQIYAKDKDGNEKYFYNDDGSAQYAVHYDNNDQREVPAKSKDGLLIYIKDETGRNKLPYSYGNNRFIFPMDPQTGMPIYPIDPVTNDPYYPSTPNNREFYGLDKDNNEVPLVNKQGIPVYAKDFENNQIYPMTKDQDEYYIRRGNREIFARKENGKRGQAYYARKKNGDEFYPRIFTQDEL